ncbi:chloride channel protein [Vagococcus carniphilus]|uniref:chloride channel protein n=1 Tax=Vagococcus carniphilus TaxID=218144 RepID=UPI003B591720
MKKQTLIIRIIFYGLLLSSLIGLISFGFIFLESHISHLLWDKLLNDMPFKVVSVFIFCILGGFCVGKLREKWGDYPQTAHDSIDQLKKIQTVNYRPAFKSLFVALLVLIFGAGVGPEAALLGAIVMLSIWQADKMRYLFFNQETFINLHPIERISHMLHPTKYLVTYNAKSAPKGENFLSTKKALNIFFSVNGLISFTILMKLTKQPSFISKMGDSSWHLKDLWVFIPLLIIGLLSGKIYNVFKKKMSLWFNFWQDEPVKKALLGSLSIFVVGIFFPNLLFSGQVALGSVPKDYVKFSFLILLLVVVIKLVFLQICLNTGWIGGDIFPIVFASIIQGFAISQVLPAFDVIFIVATVATAMAVTILDSPIGVAIFIALFFPIQMIPVIFATALILKFAKQSILKKKAKG